MNRHSTFFIDKIKRFDICNTSITELIGGKLEWAFETKPTMGEHNYLVVAVVLKQICMY
ncbi:MAG: hypothetical protein R2852_03725 [Bacteroidia bacterium]